MVKFAAAGYVCVDYYPDFNNRYYITGNGVDVLFNLLDIKKEKIWKHPLFHLVDNDRVHGTPVRGIMQDYEFSEETLEYICRHDMMHIDFTGRLNHRLGDIRKSGTKVFFDLGNNLKHPDLEEVIQNIDCGLVSFGNDFEEGKAFLKYAHSKGVKLMIATFGKLGSIAYDGSTFYKGEIVPVEHVVNTVGAGDSYFAGFISGIIDGKSIQECMRRGAEQSAKVISTFNPYL